MPHRIRAIALLLALILASWAPAVAQQVSDDAAQDITQRVRDKRHAIISFESDLQIIRADKKFMDLFFPASEFYGDKLLIPGTVNRQPDGSGYNLWLRNEASEHHKFSLGGLSLRYLGREDIQGNQVVGQSAPRKVEDPLQPSLQEAKEQIAPPDTPKWWESMTPANGNHPVDFHPLVFLWPYDIVSWDLPKAHYEHLSSKEVVFGRECDLVAQHLPDGRVIKIWIAKGLDQIVKIEVPDPSGGEALEASYTTFGPPDEKTGYQPYTRVEVTQGIKTLFQATLGTPKINPEKVVTTDLGHDQTPAPVPTRAPGIDLPPAVIWTSGILFAVSLLSVGLFFLGFRFYRFRTSRQRFSEEFIVIDEADGTFADALSKAGVAVVPFGPDVLTMERNRLGQKVTAEATERPRAVIVAPDAFGECKGYFFLLRAYVEEGGRVLVLPHTPKSATEMPLKVEMLRMSPGEAGTAYVPSGDLWSKPADLEKGASMLADKDCILRVEGKPLEPAFLAAVNKGKGVQAAVVGMHRQGRGEYLFCQLHLEKGSARGIAGRITGDLLAWLQARPTRRDD